MDPVLVNAGILFGIALSLWRRLNKICNENISNIIIVDLTKEDLSKKDFLEMIHKRTKEDIKRVNFYSSIQFFTNIFMIVGTIVYIVSAVQYARQV